MNLPSPLPGYRPKLLRAFSLVELLTVMAVATVLMAAAIPVIASINKGGELSAASRLVCNTMTMARTEAITKQTVTRFAVVKDWPGNAAANYQTVAIFQYDAAKQADGNSLNDWKQISNWENLPGATIVDPTIPGYVTGNDPNGYMASATAGNTFKTAVAGTEIELSYVEFLPSGASRLPDVAVPDVWLAITTGALQGGTLVPTTRDSNGVPTNWSGIGASTLTGRLSVQRP